MIDYEEGTSIHFGDQERANKERELLKAISDNNLKYVLIGYQEMQG